MSQALPKWVKVLGLTIIVLILLMVVFNQDQMDVYGTYLRQKSPEITTRLAQLSGEMDEAMVQQHFTGVPLRCMAQGPGNDSLGDRVCYASIDKADGDVALILAVFFRKERLVHLIVQMPWWVSDTWVRRFNAQFGMPQHAGRVSRWGGPVLRWPMPNGYVETNSDRSFNPLELNVVIWTGKAGAGF
jgi:hypothetical protein